MDEELLTSGNTNITYQPTPPYFPYLHTPTELNIYPVFQAFCNVLLSALLLSDRHRCLSKASAATKKAGSTLRKIMI